MERDVGQDRGPDSRRPALLGGGKRDVFVGERLPELLLGRHVREGDAGGRAGRIGGGQVRMLDDGRAHGR